MKNKLKTLVLSLILGATTAMAAESLVGVEGNYGSMSVDRQDVTTGYTSNENVNLMGGGLKIGAQSDEFRIFLSGNYYNSTKAQYDYVVTYGGEIDYLINPSNSFNIFLGLNAGIASIKQTDQGLSRTSSDPYFGASAGVNLHMTKSIDLELGGRVLSLDISNTKNSIKYTYNTIISGYASIIYKFQMNN